MSVPYDTTKVNEAIAALQRRGQVPVYDIQAAAKDVSEFLKDRLTDPKLRQLDRARGKPLTLFSI